MDVTIAKDVESASVSCAEVVRQVISDNSKARVSFASGTTHVSLYHCLVSMAREGEVDFGGIEAFGQNEFVGLPASHSASCRHFLDTHLFRPLALKDSQIHHFNGTGDAFEQCFEMDCQVDSHGIDLMILGLGMNGHVAMCEPDIPLDGRCAVVDLHAMTLAGLSARIPGVKKPSQAMTIGLRTIQDSRQCVILVSGKEKAQVLAQALYGPVTSKVPASSLRLHKNARVICDRAAASETIERRGHS
ncbi:MAG TPA: glucosamine-6-phosphate deaminase [Pirellulaceae bacterium]|nr:glucosamine-6-phosphate deaminase [Pirellulaceae bacterium]